MVVLPAVFGLIAALSGLIAVAARFQINPLYSVLVQLHPSARRLQAARNALAEDRTIKIGDEQNILECIHEVAATEYDNISEQWTPVEFKWTYNAFHFRYAEQREEGKQNRPDIEEEMIGHFDRRITQHLGHVAAFGGVVAVIGFVLLLLTALL